MGIHAPWSVVTWCLQGSTQLKACCPMQVQRSMAGINKPWVMKQVSSTTFLAVVLTLLPMNEGTAPVLRDRWS
jgi:hypothetical protein